MALSIVPTPAEMEPATNLSAYEDCAMNCAEAKELAKCDLTEEQIAAIIMRCPAMLNETQARTGIEVSCGIVAKGIAMIAARERML